MSVAQGYALFEEVVARALVASDPAAAMRRAARDARLPAELRRALRTAVVGEDGIRMAALLIARLRFERLLRGSPEAGAWFERDPAAFAEAFRRYHEEVLPTAFFPSEEARLFLTWRDATTTARKPRAGGASQQPARGRRSRARAL